MQLFPAPTATRYFACGIRICNKTSYLLLLKRSDVFPKSKDLYQWCPSFFPRRRAALGKTIIFEQATEYCTKQLQLYRTCCFPLLSAVLKDYTALDTLIEICEFFEYI